MKIRFLLLSLLPLFAEAQNHDQNRLFTKFSHTDCKNNVWVTFEDQLQFGHYEAPYSTGVANLLFSDTDGVPLFYNNGYNIYHLDGSTMEGGDSLWAMPFFHQYHGLSCTAPIGFKSHFVIPRPGTAHDYYYFQNIPHLFFYTQQSRLIMTRISGADVTGHGKVTLKDVVLFEDSVLLSQLNYVKHANGRDGWIIAPYVKDHGDSLWHLCSFFVGKDSIYLANEQVFRRNQAIPDHASLLVSNICNVTDDGNFYTVGGHYDISNDPWIYKTAYYLSLFCFDRCTGTFSGQSDLTLEANSTYHYLDPWITGHQFSPDGRILYVSNYSTLTQYDLYSNDLLGSMDTVATFQPYSTYNSDINLMVKVGFGYSLQGPDGRFYMLSDSFAHVVDYPNRRGTACQMRPKALQFPLSLYGHAYHPNYRLGPLDGSPCDSLGIDNIPVANYRVDDSLGLLSRYFYDLAHHEPATWLWDFGDGTTSTDTSALHSFPGAGIYKVCLTVSNANGSNTLCRDIAIGLDLPTSSPKAVSELLLKPNPAADLARATLPEDAAAARLLLLDAQGRTLREIALSPSDKDVELKLQGLPNGTYQVLLYAEGGAVIAAERLVVLR
jgi:PKD domain